MPRRIEAVIKAKGAQVLSTYTVNEHFSEGQQFIKNIFLFVL